MTRFTSFAIVAPLAWALAGGLAGSARAQSQAEIAAKLNEEGKELMYADKYAEAAKKFQEAVARVPEAKYFVNLCTARLEEGKLDEALTACNAVELNNPTPDQKARAEKLIEKINEEARKQGLELHPGGGGGGNTNVPDPGHKDPQQPPSYTPTVGKPLSTNLVTAGPPDNRYTWTLGVDFFGNGGRVGQPDAYASAGVGFRIKANYLLDQASRLGMQAYLQDSHLEPGNSDAALADSLDIIDLGLAGYKNVCLGSTPRLCVTPLLGVHLSLMSPAGDMDGFGSQAFNYAAAGGRGEVSFEFAFGRRFEHVLAAMIGVNVYSPVLAGPDASSGNLTAQERQLDKGGALAYVGFGYTYRFNTPIGSSPFIILE